MGTRYQIINLLNQINYGYKSKGRFKSLYIQYNSKRIRSAINGGHLVITNENIEKEIKKDVKVDNKKAIEKFKEMVESGMTSEKIAKAFNLETLKTMAASFDIEVTDEDTKLSIVEALMEEDEEPSED